MSNLFKVGLTIYLRKVSTPCHLLPKYFVNAPVSQMASKSFWHMASAVRNNILKPISVGQSCRCNHAGLSHSNAEKDLAEFLQGEIAQEKKSLKMKNLPAELDGFMICTNQAELSFTKKNQMETVTVSMNVNHSVDSEEVGGEDGDFIEEMKAKPSFEVDIQRSGKTLSFSCSFTQLEETGDKDAEDNFEITEVTYFEGDWNEKTYSVAADLLDESLYDLFMVILEEKGITKKFVEKVSEIATSHEHSQYIHLLENVKKFASAN